MKKTYVTPALNAVVIESTLMLAPSSIVEVKLFDDNEVVEEITEVWSNEFQGGIFDEEQ